VAFGLLGLLSLLLDGCGKPQAAPATPATRVVAITQMVSHPSLDKVYQAVCAALAQADIGPYRIVHDNAQGNLATAIQIAQRYASMRPDVVVAISTTSAQALAPALHKQAVPLVFAAVTDPQGAQLTGPYITGVTDAQPLEAQLDLCLQLLPELRKLGVLYNPGEVNSVRLIERLQPLAVQRGIRLVLGPVSGTQDVGQATARLVGAAAQGAVDAVYIPTDNTVVSALSAVLHLCREHGKPVFSADPDLVDLGVWASVGISYQAVGELAGQYVVRVLQGTPVAELPVTSPAQHVARIREPGSL
jgi:putative ABC transport system substrate-binding protein